MIVSSDWPGMAFGTADDGDLRGDDRRRAATARDLGIGAAWCWLRQVHGTTVIRAFTPGTLGEGDATFTTVPGLPLAVATADCYPVVVRAPHAVGIAHAGWRGLAAGVVAALREAMVEAGHPPVRAAIGPGIGPCCFEVGSDVADRFPSHQARTGWGTPSVDLAAALRAEVADLEIWDATACTMSEAGFHSYRRDATPKRQVAVAWLPD